MPVGLQVELDKNKYAELMRKCSLLANEAEINKAISRAAKRAATTAKAETVRQLTGENTLPASEIRGTISTRNIGSGSVMKISDSPNALPKFKGVLPREVMPPGKGPVRVQIKKGGGGVLNHAFVAKMKSGHVGVYEREKGTKTKGNKEKIDQHFGPSTPGMFGRENETEVNKAVIQKAMETFDKRVQHELERLLNG